MSSFEKQKLFRDGGPSNMLLSSKFSVFRWKIRLSTTSNRKVTSVCWNTEYLCTEG